MIILLLPAISNGLTFKSDGSVIDSQGNEIRSSNDDVVIEIDEDYKPNKEKFNYSHTNVLDGKIDFVFGGKYISKKYSWEHRMRNSITYHDHFTHDQKTTHHSTV